MEYNFNEIEQKWQNWWKENKVYKVYNNFSGPKYYVLDMFPYPSGAGLHVGHPLGYIASDIFARYKRLKGFNVLHPMGYDAFGLPAEQYAIEHGIHPAVSTESNIKNFRSQLDKIGFCFDWDREVKTSDPAYYKWTQWIFLQLFNSYFNRQTQKAEPVENLIKAFEKEGNINHPVPDARFEIRNPGFEMLEGCFTAGQWNSFDEKTKSDILMEYRLAYSGYGEVNWCEALGTVLANDEVVNGVSERGGFPVVKKKLRQWYLRITEYADRLLDGLQTVDFSDAMKEMQSNWIGKSTGAEIVFPLSVSPRGGEQMEKNGANEKMPGWGYASYKVDNAISYENAKGNRKNPTEAEAKLWEYLKASKTGYKFRRQHPIENYIADFVCLDVWLIVEIDGGCHLTEEQKEYDRARDKFLQETGFLTLRFTNENVLNNIGNVLQTIIKTCDERKNASVNKIKEQQLKEVTESAQNTATGSSPLQGEAGVRVYTTRPDTIFGVDFMVIAPELEIVNDLKSAEQAAAVDEYLAYVKSRSDRERQAEKKITGCFTGAYAVNPFNGKQIPIWISEYVLAGYGTGAIMAVPCGDDRDFRFAKHFNIPVTNIIGKYFNGEEANPTKEAVLQNSDFLNGMVMKDAIDVVIDKLEEMGIGKRKVNYKMRDAAFSRQRYWGEPFPIKWINGIAYPLDEKDLPLLLPEVESYKPGPEGEGPLANIKSWTEQHYETNTMPGYAGSSWYFLRYMDNENETEFASRKATDYWNQVDLYIGGTEHAVGHLLYSRMWTKALHDLGFIGHDEPYKKLVNQGMIQGSSRFVYRLGNLSYEIKCDKESARKYYNESICLENDWNIIEKELLLQTSSIVSKISANIFISKTHAYNLQLTSNSGVFIHLMNDVLRKELENKNSIVSNSKVEFDTIKILSVNPLRVDVNIVDGFELNRDEFKKWKNGEFQDAILFPEAVNNDKYICGAEVEKMSKSKFNTVNPDDLVNEYGADTFRMYEMFLGPVEQSKPWDTKGIEGVHRFLKKLWRLFFDELKGKIWNEEKATDAELKILHKAIKKIEEDTERFSFNTAVSAFMVAVNEIADAKCNKREILEPLLIMLAPYAPHITEELWHALGNTTTILDAAYPVFNAKYLAESSKTYPISINGKLRTTIDISLTATQVEVETIVLSNNVIKKWVEDKPVKKFIFVKNKMVNVVV